MQTCAEIHHTWADVGYVSVQGFGIMVGFLIVFVALPIVLAHAVNQLDK